MRFWVAGFMVGLCQAPTEAQPLESRTAQIASLCSRLESAPGLERQETVRQLGRLALCLTDPDELWLATKGLATALADGDDDVRMQAALALGRVPVGSLPLQAQSELADALWSSACAEARRNVRKYLFWPMAGLAGRGRATLTDLLALLREAMGEAETEIRWHAISALGLITHRAPEAPDPDRVPDLVTVLARGLTDSDPSVSHRAAWVVGESAARLWRIAPAAFATLHEPLCVNASSEQRERRLGAAQALVRVGCVEGDTGLWNRGMRMLEEELADRATPIGHRREVVRLLAALAARTACEPAASRCRAALERAATDGNEALRELTNSALDRLSARGIADHPPDASAHP